MSTLRQVLTILEAADTPLSLQGIARVLDITPGRAENMIQFWIQKGKIRLTADDQQCTSCGLSGSCSIVGELPTCYELVMDRKGYSENEVSDPGY